MKLAVISFTVRGCRLGEKLVRGLKERGEECAGYMKCRLAERKEFPQLTPVTESLSGWTERIFSEADGLIFIGAVGIAVRAVAPFLRDKMTDPAVVAVDEAGRFAVSLLSGHMGGANDLAVVTAGILGAVPVVTTATDVNHVLAVDVFARKNRMAMKVWKEEDGREAAADKKTDKTSAGKVSTGRASADRAAADRAAADRASVDKTVEETRQLAKEISADLLCGVPVGLFSDFAIEDGVPGGFAVEKLCERNVWISVRQRPEKPVFAGKAKVLQLIPRSVYLGAGCRKGTSGTEISAAFRNALSRWGWQKEAVVCVASIDLKAEEPGLAEAATELGVPFVTYSAEELKAVCGTFTESEFVRSVTGIGNVCERAAILAAGSAGSLIKRKTVYGSVTVAAALSDDVLLKVPEGISK